MLTSNHYFIEENQDGKFAVKKAGVDRPVSLHNTQEEAITAAKQLNPKDHPDVERIRNVSTGGRDKWRSA